MGMKKSAIVSSIATIALCAGLITGSTLALFEQETRNNIVVSSAHVKLEANIPTNSLDLVNDENNSGVFPNGGTATIDGNNLKLDKITPGDGVTFNIAITNESSIPLTYSVELIRPTEQSNATDEEKKAVALANALVVTLLDENNTEISANQSFSLPSTIKNATVKVKVEFPAGVSNVDYDYLQGATESTIAVVVKAVQANGAT